MEHPLDRPLEPVVDFPYSVRQIDQLIDRNVITYEQGIEMIRTRSEDMIDWDGPEAA